MLSLTRATSSIALKGNFLAILWQQRRAICCTQLGAIPRRGVEASFQKNERGIAALPGGRSTTAGVVQPIGQVGVACTADATPHRVPAVDEGVPLHLLAGVNRTTIRSSVSEMSNASNRIASTPLPLNAGKLRGGSPAGGAAATGQQAACGGQNGSGSGKVPR